MSVCTRMCAVITARRTTHTRADRGAVSICAPLHAWTERYLGNPTVLLFNPDSNGLVRKAATFYYLSEKNGVLREQRVQIKQQ